MSESTLGQQGGGLSRRTLLRWIVAAPLIGVVGTAGVEAKQFHDRQRDVQSRERQVGETYAYRVRQGMKESWITASVWPGLAILPSSVRLFATPTLHHDTEVEWPQDKRDQHLTLQRPFMVRASLEQNNYDHEDETVPVGDEVMGFWLPGTNTVAFIDREHYSHQILLPSHSGKPVYTDNFAGIVGESILLEAPVTRQGLTWRYLKSERVYQEGDANFARRAVSVNKVVGCSVWSDTPEALGAYNAFETEGAFNIIRLPEP
ncbi:MAG: hypothetical protein V4702_03870 [Patescibacteria group bacterium]